MTSLEDLFAQIIHTEQKAQEKRNFLTEIKVNVQAEQEKVKETEKECVCLQGQLATKIQQLNEDELAYTLVQHREETLLSQLDELKKEKAELEKRVEEILAKKNEETEQFCSQMEEFIESYSLTSNGQAVRVKQAKEETSHIRESYEKLLHEQQLYDQKKEISQTQEKKLQQLKDEKIQLEQELEDLKTQLEKEKTITSEKELLLNSPKNTPEFVKLQHQLDILKNENLEEKCNELQKELCRLQQQCWQKQVKERQRQQEITRRNRLKEQKETTTANRVHLSNFSTCSSSQIESISNEEFDGLFTEDSFTQASSQKSFQPGTDQ